MPQPATDTLTPQVKDTVLALLRSALWGQERFPFQPDSGTDWSAVYTELCHQTVQHLPVDLLVSADPQNAMRYIQSTAKNIQKWHYLMKQQEAICDDLAQMGIPCAILKGAAAARYYPQPEHRCMGDIDLIVRPEDFDRAMAYFREPWKAISDDFRHVEFRNGKFDVELHRKFSMFRSPERCHFLDERLFRDILQGTSWQLDTYRFPVVGTTANGLVFLTHINAHMESGLGLRQMIDWMMYVDQELNDDFWRQEFQQAAQFLGLEKLAVTVTRMCQLYLGLREDITWCRNADEILCRDLIEHTFRQGNFGRKLPENLNLVVSIFSTLRNIPAFFREMQNRGLVTWRAAKKHPGLRPFAWLYQIFRCIARGLKMEHPIRSVFQALKSQKQQGSLLDRLEVSRMNNDH